MHTKCLLCGGRLRKLNKTKDWDFRRFHINCWREVEGNHLHASEHFINLKKKYDKIVDAETPMIEAKRRYIKRKGLKLCKFVLDEPITIHFD